MNVTNLSTEKRLELFNKWLNKSRNPRKFDFGNDIDLTPEQINDPNYIIPEWGIPVPQRYRDEKIAENIGRKCITSSGISGTLLGLNVTYEDFYYRIMTDDGSIVYDTCVNGIKFLDS